MIQTDSVTKKLTCFDPEAIFTCGQCFRWTKNEDKSFTGVALGRALRVFKENGEITFEGTNEDEFDSVWCGYFDIDRDYNKIANTLSGIKNMKSAVTYGSGIRILRQDFFECLLSFIISANNNIPRIQGIVNKMSELWGKEITFKGEKYYTFPTPDALCGITAGDLAPLRCGYRAPYLEKTIAAYCRGDISAEEINSMNTPDARRALLKLCGVGPKVADCVLLFAFSRFDVFPADVWIKRVMHELYGCEEKNAAECGTRLFGNLAGIAQQYLFYERRDNAI